MTGRVDRFATLVEETGAGRHHRRPIDVDAELLALVGVAHRLARAPASAPAVREGFREELQDRLLAEFAKLAERTSGSGADQMAQATADADRRASEEKTQVVRQLRRRPGLAAGAFRPGLAARALRPSGRARLAAIIGVATGTLALSGVSLASGDAVPGDPLYSVKRSGEQAQLVLAVSDDARGRLHLDFARIRLVEARQVPPAQVGEVLAEMDRAVIDGARMLFSAAVQRGDEAPIDSVTAFVATHRSDLLELRAAMRAPGDPVLASLDLLDAVEIRAKRLRAALAGGCTPVSVDELGPQPAC